jgi:hypothetical protein
VLVGGSKNLCESTPPPPHLASSCCADGAGAAASPSRGCGGRQLSRTPCSSVCSTAFWSVSRQATKDLRQRWSTAVKAVRHEGWNDRWDR